MKSFNFGNKYLILFVFIILFISLGSSYATDDSNYSFLDDDNHIDDKNNQVILNDKKVNEKNSSNVFKDTEYCCKSFSNSDSDKVKTFGFTEYVDNKNVINKFIITNSLMNKSIISNVIGSVDTVSSLNSINYDFDCADKVSSYSDASVKTIISANDLTIYYGNNTYIIGYLKTSSGKLLKNKSIKLISNTKKIDLVTDSNGRFKYKFGVLPPKVYTICFKFLGDSNYLPSSKNLQITVKKAQSKLTNINLVGNAIFYRINACLKDNLDHPIQSEYVTFNINGKNYNNKTDSNGKVSLYVDLVPKSYSCLIKYSGNVNYTSLAKSLNFTIKKSATKLVTSNLHIFNSETDLYACLIDCYNDSVVNRTVNLVLNGKSYSGVTDDFGFVSFKLPSNLKLITYNATFKFKGDSIYLPSSTNFKFKIHDGWTLQRDSVVSYSSDFVDYLELNHKFPASINVKNLNLSLSSYAQILAEIILSNSNSSNFDLDNNSYECIKFSSIKSETIKNSFEIFLPEYLTLVTNLYNHMLSNGTCPSSLSLKIDGVSKNISFNSLVYFMSEVVNSYKHCGFLPDFLNFVPWNIVSNSSTIFYNHDKIINSSINLKNYIFLNRAIPKNTSINYSRNKSFLIDITQALYLYNTCIKHINFNIYQSVIFNNIKVNYASYETIINGHLDVYEYYSLIYDLDNFFNNLNKSSFISNLSNVSLGEYIGFNSLVLMETNILESYYNYSFNNGNHISASSINSTSTISSTSSVYSISSINSTSTISSTSSVYSISSINSISNFDKDYTETGLPIKVNIIPWIAISNPNKIYNYRSAKFFDSIQDAINDKDTLNKDFIGVGKTKIYENIVINKTIYLVPLSNFTSNDIKFYAFDYSKPIISLLSNDSLISGFSFIGRSTGIEINGSSNEISQSIFKSFNKSLISNGFNNSIISNELDNCYDAILSSGDSLTIDSNEINSSNYAIKLLNSDGNLIINNIIHGNNYSLYISKSSADINYNSINSKVYVDLNSNLDLNDNWWGFNNPNFTQIIKNFNVLNYSNNISLNSWIILKADSFIDWSSSNLSNYLILVIANLRYNNLGKELTDIGLDNLNISFKTNYGNFIFNNVFNSSNSYLDSNSVSIFNSYNYNNTLNNQLSNALTYGNQAIVGLNISSINLDSDNKDNQKYADVVISLNNQTIVNKISIPVNSYAVVNKRSNKFYFSIQEAIDSNITKNGDILILNNGIFNENIFLYKNITLKGNGTVYLNQLNESLYTITILTNESFIENLIISSNEDSYAVSGFGGKIHFKNCTFTDSKIGLYLVGCVNSSVENCSFIKNQYGSYLSYCDFQSFNKSYFSQNSYGIYSLNNNKLTITNSKFNDCWIDVDLVKSNNTVVSNISFEDSYLSLELINSINTNICNNKFFNNTIGYSIYNSSIKTSNNSFKGNLIADYSSFDEDKTIVLQKDIWTCGPACLATVLHKLGYKNFDLNNIVNNITISNKGTNLLSLYNYLRNNDVKNFTNAKALFVNSSKLSSLDIILLNISGELHYSVILNITNDTVILADSTVGLLNISRFSFDELFSGYVLIVDGKNRSGIILSNQELSNIYGTFDVIKSWEWLNNPIYTIPGYADLDEKYGVLGESVKLAGWFMLGIDDNGGISPLDLCLDVISIFSGSGLLERASFSISKLAKTASKEKIIIKLAKNKNLNKISNMVKNSDLFKKLVNSVNYAYTNLNSFIKSASFDAYKTVLSAFSNPTKFVISKELNKLVSAENIFSSTLSKYLDNSFRTATSILGIGQSYNNSLNNIYFVGNLVFNDGKSLKSIVKNSKSSIASTIKNVVNSASKYLKPSANFISKGIKSLTNKVKSTYKVVSNKFNNLKSKAVKKVNYIVKKISSPIKRTVNKIYNKVKHVSTKIVNYCKPVKKVATTIFNKASNFASNVVNRVSNTFRSWFHI